MLSRSYIPAQDVVIANGATVSAWINVQDMGGGQVQLPATIDAGTLNWECSVELDGSNPQPLLDPNNLGPLANANVTGGEILNFPPSAYNTASLRVVMGTAQTAARTLRVFRLG